MMRLATAVALLTVFAATPALAIVCKTRCADPVAQTGRASHASHTHHHTGPQSSVFSLRSSVLETGPEHACLSHIDTGLGTTERSTFAAAELAPAGLRPFQPIVPLGCAGWLDESRPPPLEPRVTTPLRI